MVDVPLIVHPLAPKGGGWAEWDCDTSRWPSQPYAIKRYYNRGQEMQVLSAIEMILPEGSRDGRPEYHLSVSGLAFGADRPYRVSDSRARWVLKAFDLEGWFEDNHVPGGLVRNYYGPSSMGGIGRSARL